MDKCRCDFKGNMYWENHLQTVDSDACLVFFLIFSFLFRNVSGQLRQIKSVKNNTKPLSPRRGVGLHSQCLHELEYAYMNLNMLIYFFLSVSHWEKLQNHSRNHIISEEPMGEKLVVENERKTSMAIGIFMHNNTIFSVWSPVYITFIIRPNRLLKK